MSKTYARCLRYFCITGVFLATFPGDEHRLSAASSEPAGYRLNDYRASVPNTLKGVRTVSGDEVRALWLEGKTVFIDVMPHAPRPPNLPPDIIWRDKVRENIPGSSWLPDVGYGRLSAATDAYFRRHLARLTKGDLAKPILIYCIADCWMSWNAAKRAREEYGYLNVIWFPDGSEAWAFDGHKLEKARPEP